jgi:endonuclease V-like protein UPF0215 family
MSDLIIALDDGYFPPIKKGKTTIAGVRWRRNPEKSIIDLIDIDGLNATQKAIEVINRLEACSEDTVVLLDGVAYAGFNFVDPEEINGACESGFIVVFYRPLDIDRIKNALQKNFEDWDKRLQVFTKAYQSTRIIITEKGRIYVYSNLDSLDAQKIISNIQIYSSIPEPLRLAHLIASEASLFLRRKKTI